MADLEPFEGDRSTPETSPTVSGESGAEVMPASEFSKAQLLTNASDALDGATFHSFVRGMGSMRGRTASLGEGLSLQIIGSYDGVGQLEQVALIAEKAEADGSKVESYTALHKGRDNLHSVQRQVYRRTPDEVKSEVVPNVSTDRAAALKQVFEMAARDDPGTSTTFEQSLSKAEATVTPEDKRRMVASLDLPSGESAELTENDAQAINRIIKGVDWKRT